MKIYIAVFGLLVALVGPQAQAENRYEIPMPADLASRQISVKVLPNITTRSLRPASLRQARLNMQAGREISETNLRALASHGDGLAALKYVRLLVSRHGGQREHASDIAYFGATAVGTGRVWPLADMINAMHALDPETEPKARVNKYIRVLYAHAWAGNDLALDAVIDLNGEDRLFGKMSERTRQRILNQSRENGTGRGELRMAVNLLMNPDLTPSDTELARIYLGRAVAADNLSVKVTAANLLLLLEGDGT